MSLEDSSYPIEPEFEGESLITSLSDLREWANNRADSYRSYLNENGYENHSFSTDEIGGIQYFSASLGYDPEDGFYQSGNGPNYFGGLYSLATCRYDLRATEEMSYGKNFEEHFELVSPELDLWLPKYPVLIFNSTQKTTANEQHQHWLTSVSFVTHAFRTMEGYASYLLENFDGRCLTHRLTRANDAPQEAIKHGDCHADWSGKTGGPPEGHPHHKGSKSSCGCSVGDDRLHDDNADNHLKALSISGYWHTFSEPVLYNKYRTGKIDKWEFKGIEEAL